MSNMTDTALVIMARYPQMGKTKTRLARTLGDVETLNLYRAFLTDLAQHHAGQSYALCWAYTPTEVDYQSFVATLAPAYADEMQCFPQQGPELGARLYNVFEWTKARGFQHTIVIGSDSPHLSREIIANARVALDEVDVVLGPADDGGYYLIGMQTPHDVFSGIPMSTEVVTKMTIEAAQRQDLTVRLIDPLFDVDERPDLLRLAQLLAADSTLAPVTAAHLANMRSFHDDNTNHACNDAATLDIHRANQPL